MTRSSDHVNGTQTSEIALDMTAERRLIGRGSFRHIDFRVRVSPSRTADPHGRRWRSDWCSTAAAP